MTIRSEIKIKAEGYRKWRYRATDADPREVETRIDALIAQCESVAECRHVSRAAATAPVKNAPGREPDAEINAWALQVLDRISAHGGNIKSAAREVLQDHIQKTFAGDDAQATRFFNRVCKRVYVLKQNARNPYVAVNS